MSRYLIQFVIVSLIFITGMCKIDNYLDNPKTNHDSILLQAIREYDSIIENEGVTIKAIGILKCQTDVDNCVYSISSVCFQEIVPFHFYYQYGGFKKPVFSNFAFINPVSDRNYNRLIKKYFNINFDVTEKKNEVQIPDRIEDIINIDGRFMNVYFHKNELLKKGIELY
jgi:hypothetical protein